MINDTNIQKARISIKVLTLIPVFFLGIVALVSNISSIINIRSVNGTATTIADEFIRKHYHILLLLILIRCLSLLQM